MGSCPERPLIYPSLLQNKGKRNAQRKNQLSPARCMVDQLPALRSDTSVRDRDSSFRRRRIPRNIREIRTPPAAVINIRSPLRSSVLTAEGLAALSALSPATMFCDGTRKGLPKSHHSKFLAPSQSMSMTTVARSAPAPLRPTEIGTCAAAAKFILLLCTPQTRPSTAACFLSNAALLCASVLALCERWGRELTVSSAPCAGIINPAKP